MATSLDELIREMNTRPRKVELGWEVLPALDGTLHAVDPDPDAPWSNQFSVSLCRRVLRQRDGVVTGSGVCDVCQEICRERQAEFDAREAA